VIAKYGGKLQAQGVTAQSSFYSVNDRRLHFGLGESKLADLDIHWTNGGVEKLTGIKARQFITVKEGEGIIKTETWTSPEVSEPHKV
jgi:hypothetical protein